MDSELKKMKDLEKQILELTVALEKEQLKAKMLNHLIETSNEQLGIDMIKIVIPPDCHPSNT